MEPEPGCRPAQPVPIGRALLRAGRGFAWGVCGVGVAALFVPSLRDDLVMAMLIALGFTFERTDRHWQVAFPVAAVVAPAGIGLVSLLPALAVPWDGFAGGACSAAVGAVVYSAVTHWPSRAG